VDLRVYAGSGPPALNLNLVEAGLRGKSDEAVPLDPVHVPVVNRIHLNEQVRPLVVLGLVAQELVVERKAEIA